MSVSEYERHQIFQWYEDAMGSDRASIMMQLLPPVGWGDVATRGDLVALRTELRGEIAELRGDFAELRGDFAELRGELSELRGEMHLGHAKLLRSMYLAVLASNATVAGVVLAAVRLAA